MYKMGCVGFSVALGFVMGFLTLSFHPQMSYFGVEFLRSQSPDSLTILDFPHPYSPLSRKKRIEEAKQATQFYLQQAPSRWNIHRYHFGKTFSLIHKNTKRWARLFLKKLCFFIGFVEFNNPYTIGQLSLFIYFIGILSLMAGVSLLTLFTHKIVQFSWGFILPYFVFYSTSSFRFFLIPLYLVLAFLLIKNIFSVLQNKQWIRLSFFLFAIVLVVGVIRIPYVYSFSIKNLHRLHKANGFWMSGERLLHHNKKLLAFHEFLKGLQAWSYHSSLRVEVAKIYLEENDLERALNMLRNPRDNAFAHEVLAHIFLQHSKGKERAILNLKKAIELRPFAKRFYEELSLIEQKKSL